MKETTLIFLGIGGLLFLALRGKGTTAPSKVATTNSAGTPNWLSDYFKNLPDTKTTPDTAQTISAIGGIFGDILKGLGKSGGSKNGIGVGAGGGGGGYVNPKSSSPRSTAEQNNAYDNLNTTPVDIYGDQPTGSDLPAYDFSNDSFDSSYLNDYGSYDWSSANSDYFAPF